MARIFPGISPRDERGFSILESTVAIGLFATVLLGMLGSMSVGVKGVLTGRQRNNAVGIADQVMEQLRGMRYDRVGHVATDPTLATDTSFSPAGPVAAGAEINRTYTGTNPPEQLVGSTVPNPNFYLNEHIRTTRPDGASELDGNTFTVATYVTAVPAETLGGLPGKRVTVIVNWDKGQYDSAGVASELKVSSLLSPTVAPSPVLTGLTEATGGSVLIENESGGSWYNQTGVSSSQAWFGSERGTLDFGVTDQVSGSAVAGRTATETPGGYFGWGAESTECEGTRAETLVDNDGDGVLDQSSGSLSSTTCSAAATWFSFLFGSTGGGSGTAGGTVQVDSTVDSCSTSSSPATCSAPRLSIGDNDGLPYQYSRAIGPDSIEVTEARGADSYYSWWFWGTSTGNLVRSAPGAAAGQWDGTLDVDDVSGFKQLSATTTMRQPGMEYVSLKSWRWSGCSLLGCAFDGTLAGTPLVTVSPINITAVARSGQGYPAAPIGPSGPSGPSGPNILSDRPDLAGVGTSDPVEISIYDTTGAPGVPAGFKTLEVTPGVAGTWTYNADLLVDQSDSTFGSWNFGSDTTYTMAVSVVAAPKVLTWTVNPPPDNTVYTSAGAGISDWLTITITITTSNTSWWSSTTSSKTITHNFGGLLSQASYAPSTS